MVNPYAKTALLSVIPKLVHTAYDFLFGKKPKKFLSTTKRLKIQRKPADTRPISRQQYDYINDARVAWRLYNLERKGSERKTRTDLVNAINSALNLDKSESYYGDIWAGRKKRESFIDANQQSE